MTRRALTALLVLAPALGLLAARRAGPFLSGGYEWRRYHDPETVGREILAALPVVRRAWPGYEPLDPPLYLTTGRGTSVLVGSTAPPAKFHTRWFAPSGLTFTRRRIRPRGTPRYDFVIDASTVAALIIGATDYPPTTYFLHERFHRYQERAFRWKNPLDDYPVADGLDVALAAEENDALASWLERGDEDAMRDFAALRLRRRALFPGSAAEEQQERLEGTAQFVETAAMEVSSGAVNARARVLRDLRREKTLHTLTKWRDYAVGVVLCRWLDARGVPGWRDAVAGGWSPSALVVERLGLSPEEAGRRAERRMAAPAFARTLDESRRDVAEELKTRDEEMADWNALTGRRLVVTDKATTGGFDGPWWEYPGHRHLLVARRWMYDSPHLHAELGHDKGILQDFAAHTEEFVVPPDAFVRLDGRPWTFHPGKARFRTIVVSSAPRVWLEGRDGTLDDDGTRVRLQFDPDPGRGGGNRR